MTLFSRLCALVNLRENKLIANKKCFTVHVLHVLNSDSKTEVTRVVRRQRVRRRQPNLNSNYQLVYVTVKSKIKVFVYGQQRWQQGYDNSSKNIYVPAN